MHLSGPHLKVNTTNLIGDT
jgi:hypothetical protein